MPSEHTNITLSVSRLRGIILIEGLQITPQRFAIASPSDRDIARPGYRDSLVHTRIGPIFFPVSAE